MIPNVRKVNQISCKEEPYTLRVMPRMFTRNPPSTYPSQTTVTDSFLLLSPVYRQNTELSQEHLKQVSTKSQKGATAQL